MLRYHVNGIAQCLLRVLHLSRYPTRDPVSRPSTEAARSALRADAPSVSSLTIILWIHSNTEATILYSPMAVVCKPDSHKVNSSLPQGWVGTAKLFLGAFVAPSDISSLSWKMYLAVTSEVDVCLQK